MKLLYLTTHAIKSPILAFTAELAELTDSSVTLLVGTKDLKGIEKTESNIKKVAEAEKFKKLTIAHGEAEAIETVYSAIHNGNPTKDLITIKYLEALEKIADGKATKLFLPLETSGILGSLAGIAEIFKEKIIKKEK